MMLPVHLQRSAIAAIVDCPVPGQSIGSRSLKPVAPQLIWFFQESLSNQRANEALLRILSEQGLPLVLGAREDLWAEAYKDVGEGAEWCIKN
jgi:hypothetical protein